MMEATSHVGLKPFIQKASHDLIAWLFGINEIRRRFLLFESVAMEQPDFLSGRDNSSTHPEFSSRASIQN
jgi:hypothetical protein